MKSVRRGAAVYRRLLRGLPPAFRERHEREMLEWFSEHHANTAGKGGIRRRIGFWLLILGDLARTVVVERGREWRRRREARSRQRTNARERRTMRPGFPKVSTLDVKLGVRMVLRYPALSLVSVVGMAVAIAIGAGYYGVTSALLDSELPLPDGDRIVALRNLNLATGGFNGAESAQDLLAWREQLESVEDVSAFRDVNRNLIRSDGRADVVSVAEITASGLALAGVAPMLGRPLLAEDERPGTQDVLVIGHEAWQRVFQGADVIGRTVHLGDAVHTIVGVMPPGFAFPVRHQYWVPLRLDLRDEESFAGLTVFGRLGDGVSVGQAQAELEAMGRRMAVEFPHTHENLRPRLTSYTAALAGSSSPRDDLLMRGVQLLWGVLLIIVAVNVAVLIYARTATRLGEIAVRGALGASRRRIVGQLFIEAAVLATVAAAAGLMLARMALGSMQEKLSQSTDWTMPFWIDFGLSAGQVTYVLALTLLASAILGVVPALKVTRSPLDALKEAAARGSAGLKLGRTWTALIVLQVAIAVAALPPAIRHGGEMLQIGTRAPATIAYSMLRATLVFPGGPEAAEELIRRLETEPEVRGVTYAHRFPGSGGGARLQADGVEFWAASNGVARDFFEVFDVPLVDGRWFSAADEHRDAPAVIVNEAFAARLGGGSALGQRVRYTAWGPNPERSFEIVGVVRNFAEGFQVPGSASGPAPQIFHAVPAASAPRLALILRVRGQPAAFGPQLRALTAGVDPTMHVEELETVVEKWHRDRMPWWLFGLGIAATMGSVLMLSAAGMYAMMSFTVARRRREIGIRTALGADAGRVLAGIFGRAGAQLGTGVVGGLALTAAMEYSSPGLVLDGRGALILPLVIAVILVVGLLAVLGPARRAFAVQPTEVLRDNG